MWFKLFLSMYELARSLIIIDWFGHRSEYIVLVAPYGAFASFGADVTTKPVFNDTLSFDAKHMNVVGSP